MTKRNFASTAAYFERRAGKVHDVHRRAALRQAAQHYRARSDMSGDQPAAAAEKKVEPDIPPRRKRLIELFRAQHNGPAID